MEPGSADRVAQPPGNARTIQNSSYKLQFHMDTKLILLDLDFTLLKSDRTISQKSIETLKACQEKGIKVGFSTSRGNTNIQQYVDLVHPDVIICNAGANTFYNNKLIHTQAFTLEQTQRLFDAAYQVSGTNIEMTCDTAEELFWNRKEDKSDQFMPDATFDDFHAFKLPALKMCIQTKDQDLINRIIEKAGVEDCKAMLFSDIPWFKLAPKSATKENAILFLSDYLQISTDQMIAFGDDFSDIGMLKLCGRGIAMGNAIPQVKEIADEITLTNDEDGVAVYLERFVK